MPSAFEQFFADRAQVVYAVHGVSASYADPSGNKTANLVIQIDRHDATPTESAGRAIELQTAEIVVAALALANPVKGGRFTLEGSEVWSIENTPTRMNGQHYCTCVRVGVDRLLERREKS